MSPPGIASDVPSGQMDRIVLEALSVVETMAVQLVTVRPTLFLRDHFLR